MVNRLDNRSDLTKASYQQEGVWFHSVKHSTSYWNFLEKKFYVGNLNVGRCKRALGLVLQRHDSLRARFRLHNDRLYQVVDRDIDVDEVFFIQNSKINQLKILSA